MNSERKPLGKISINPLITNIFIDSCAFDPKYDPEDQASEKLFELFENSEINLIITHSNQKEIDHPNTPVRVKVEANKMIFSIETPLTNDQIKKKEKILQLLTGAGNPDNFRDDTEHIFNASIYGPYFVTVDKRILKKEKELYHLCGVQLIKPSNLLDKIQEYKNI